MPNQIPSLAFFISIFQIAVLEQLGIENSCIMLDEVGGISYFGSKRGTDFLATCGSLDFEFKKFFGKNHLLVDEFSATEL